LRNDDFLSFLFEKETKEKAAFLEKAAQKSDVRRIAGPSRHVCLRDGLQGSLTSTFYLIESALMQRSA